MNQEHDTTNSNSKIKILETKANHYITQTLQNPIPNKMSKKNKNLIDGKNLNKYSIVTLIESYIGSEHTEMN